VYKKILIDANIKIKNWKGGKKTADWEKSIKEAKVRIGL
jgi:hypothetical protein